MKLSCCAYSYRDDLTTGRMTLEQFLDTASATGFEGVELTAYYFPQTDPAYLRRLKRETHLRGLTISGAAIGTDFADPDPEKRAAHVASTVEWLRNAGLLGAPTLRVFAGTVRDAADDESSLQWTAEALNSCIPAAQEQGVLLALENHHGLTATAEQTLRLLDLCQSEWIGLNLDFGNFRGDIYRGFAACAPRAIAAHAKRHFRTETGMERVDYARVRAVLEESGYRGWIAIEYEDPDDPHVGVPIFAQELREAFR